MQSSQNYCLLKQEDMLLLLQTFKRESNKDMIISMVFAPQNKFLNRKSSSSFIRIIQRNVRFEVIKILENSI